MADWRDNVVTALVQFGVGENIVPFNRERVYQLMQSLAETEKIIEKEKRIGFLYCLESYSETGLNTLLNKAEAAWPFQSNAPQPPEIPTESKASSDSAHLLDCVVAIKLDSNGYNPETLLPTFRDYLVEAIESPFAAIPLKIAPVHDSWYDIYVRYSVPLMDIYELLKSIPWIKDIVTKPSVFFGRRTIHTLR